LDHFDPLCRPRARGGAWGCGSTKQEIAEAVGVDQTTVGAFMQNLGKTEAFPKSLKSAISHEADFDLARPAAKERQKEGRERGGKTAGKGRPIGSAKVSHNLKHRAVDEVASAVGMSGRTWEKVKAVMESA
jgi:hypothetical protein